jgi:hypothetical protein
MFGPVYLTVAFTCLFWVAYRHVRGVYEPQIWITFLLGTITGISLVKQFPILVK